MERVYERCGALDVRKQQVTVCVHVPDRRGERSELRAEFGTMTGDLLGLRGWLKGLGVIHVAMEATGVYWRPVYYLLEGDFELLLVNAQQGQECARQRRTCRTPSGSASCSSTAC
jgi:transposase